MRAALVTSATVALLAACGATSTGTVPASRPTTATAGTGATAAGNERDAREHARRLLALARFPDGASPATALPSVLAGPMSVPAASRVDETTSRRVPMAAAAALAWVEAHPPAGLFPFGGSQASGPSGVTEVGSTFTDRTPSPAWESASLEVGIAPDGPAASVVRFDAVVVWLDPVPLPDRDPGPRIRLTVAGGCPASDLGAAGPVGVTGGGPGLDRRLLPGPAPSGGLVCRYGGGNASPPMHLTATVHLDTAAAGRLATAVLAVPLGHAVGEVRSCPMDDGTAVLVALAYPGRPDADLRIATRGCTGIGNGTILAGRPGPLPGI